MSRVTEMTLAVKGMKFRTTISTRRMIQAHVEEGGVECALVRESSNVVDENAVRVVITSPPYDGLHIGYVDKGIAAKLAPVLDQGLATVPVVILTEMDAQEGTATISAALKTTVQAKSKVAKKKSARKP